MQNYSHQGPTMLNLPHDIITAVPGQEHGRTQDSKGPPNHGCVSMPALYRTRAPASDYELTTTRPAVVPCRVGRACQGASVHRAQMHRPILPTEEEIPHSGSDPDTLLAVSQRQPQTVLSLRSSWAFRVGRPLQRRNIKKPQCGAIK